MAIRRTSLDRGNGLPLICFEVDEWAEENRVYEIDCSLPSPTKEATPVPDWIIFEGLYWKDRHETFLYYNNIALGLGYGNLDEYLNDYPQYFFLNQASEVSRCQWVSDELPNITDRQAFVDWYRNQQPDIWEY
ncbi:hypothetical protein GTQ43_30520 [Nostoc sp. KVJ3]|uniref:hypothetical protein n=1 Tax=Nostoc sp. KVJ3 TaxID=457945 RepID=UPI002237D1E9|nr:hypothetical protein [Nostoc sp. KVJ3]MCW5317948.1 hypothetical protein [Nostoc sp. KVJ3]